MKELLTGKCKEDFERWFDGRYTYLQLYVEFYNNGGLNFYTEIPFVSQYGVYLEFFDSVSILIHNDNPTRSGEWEVCVNGKSEVKETRQEAQQQAIIKANTIYNEK